MNPLNSRLSVFGTAGLGAMTDVATESKVNRLPPVPTVQTPGGRGGGLEGLGGGAGLAGGGRVGAGGGAALRGVGGG